MDVMTVPNIEQGVVLIIPKPSITKFSISFSQLVSGLNQSKSLKGIK